MWIALAFALAVCYAALPPPSHLSPAEAAAELFVDADADGDGKLHLQEMVSIFDKYDTNGDHRVSRQEYLNYTRHHEPDLVTMATTLYQVLDHDHDNRLELSDYMHLFLDMNPNATENTVSEWTFIGYFTVLYTTIQSA